MAASAPNHFESVIPKTYPQWAAPSNCCCWASCWSHYYDCFPSRVFFCLLFSNHGLITSDSAQVYHSANRCRLAQPWRSLCWLQFLLKSYVGRIQTAATSNLRQAIQARELSFPLLQGQYLVVWSAWTMLAIPCLLCWPQPFSSWLWRLCPQTRRSSFKDHQFWGKLCLLKMRSFGCGHFDHIQRPQSFRWEFWAAAQVGLLSLDFWQTLPRIKGRFQIHFLLSFWYPWHFPSVRCYWALSSASSSSDSGP